MHVRSIITYPRISDESPPQGSLPAPHICIEHAGPPPVGVPSVQDRARQTLPASAIGAKASRAARDGTESCIFTDSRLKVVEIEWFDGIEYIQRNAPFGLYTSRSPNGLTMTYVAEVDQRAMIMNNVSTQEWDIAA